MHGAALKNHHVMIERLIEAGALVRHRPRQILERSNEAESPCRVLIEVPFGAGRLVRPLIAPPVRTVVAG